MSPRVDVSGSGLAKRPCRRSSTLRLGAGTCAACLALPQASIWLSCGSRGTAETRARTHVYQVEVLSFTVTDASVSRGMRSWITRAAQMQSRPTDAIVQPPARYALVYTAPHRPR
ncbi:uncharacterized protein M421DRAFT_164888 [Didymella exigua CBS 183.55]|uniref:Uncharacterized protein n=1 Tax=Didymella exigua CBS 183.55 TaxID=1150837 RepID=A0A6A5RL33_9PLEO|nr:uncharacterized protein M421DRAFT_164888 [Didymella exigua CBS 183.55]KAF1927960.1 hypothetical protein M421DRAFT_164888 [Didymella exigua CBS 183.55]